MISTEQQLIRYFLVSLWLLIITMFVLSYFVIQGHILQHIYITLVWVILAWLWCYLVDDRLMSWHRVVDTIFDILSLCTLVFFLYLFWYLGVWAMVLIWSLYIWVRWYDARIVFIIALWLLWAVIMSLIYGQKELAESLSIALYYSLIAWVLLTLVTDYFSKKSSWNS